MQIKRRDFITYSALLAGSSAFASTMPKSQRRSTFPENFLWGVATSGHQTEGNNTASDTWFLENIKPSAFAEPSGDACNSFELWETDLQLVKNMGLNSYRFSIEWARIEPEPGLFSNVMLGYYKKRIARCREMGLLPLVTFNHFTAPRWFAELGGWLNPKAPDLFARYCEQAAKHLSEHIEYAFTLNEPNLLQLLKWQGLPDFIIEKQKLMLQAAAKKTNVAEFSSGNATNFDDLARIQPILLKAHRAAFNAIKSVRPNLPVGVSIAITDDQAVGPNSRRDEKREILYAPWLESAKQDDFLGVQNYERSRLDAKGELPPPEGSVVGLMGAEVYPPSLAGAVEYAYSVTGKPIMVSEHGVNSEDDAVRAWLIPNALAALQESIDKGVPVLGYMHWSLMDNFEWVFGYGPKFGLHSVDRQTFKRTPKPSAKIYGDIALRNGL